METSTIRSLALGLTGVLVMASPGTAGDWVSLFDGKSLEGWTQRNGTATYRIDGDSIVGKTAEGSPNSFLCTDRDYGDFELEFDVKVDSRLNSGVQIRSRTRSGRPDGRVNGPQVEIESHNKDSSTSGYIYGEAAGGWMTPEEARAPHSHFKAEAWNTYRVLAVGAKIKVWVNQALVSDLVDAGKYTTHPRGFIGLQVHGIERGAGPYEVRWRNIRIREIEDGDHRDGWQALYNGKDLTGWRTTGNWLPQADGVLLIKPRPGETGWQRYSAYLWSEKKYNDFILDVEYSYPPGGNSGIFFRVGSLENPVESGIEAQVLDSTGHQGEMTLHDHGGIIRTAGPTKNMSNPPNTWNRMLVTCRGHHLVVELNDEKIIDVELDQTPMKDRPLEGYIGLQDHGEPNDIRFRNIRIKEL